MWVALKASTQSHWPLAIVSSGSMRPAFNRGDIIFLKSNNGSYDVGDIVLFEVPLYQFPFVHRVVEARVFHNGSALYLTKGDYLQENDRQYYSNSTKWLPGDKVFGKVIAVVPYLGHFTILMAEIPALRILFLSLVCVLFMVSRNGLQGAWIEKCTAFTLYSPSLIVNYGVSNSMHIRC